MQNRCGRMLRPWLVWGRKRETVVMDGDRTRAKRCLWIDREFEGNRLAGRFLAEVYERVAPIHRMVIPTGGRKDGGHERKPGNLGDYGLGAGGYRCS